MFLNIFLFLYILIIFIYLLYIFLFIFIFIYIYIYIYTCILYVYMYIYICVYTDLLVCIYIYIHICICICIYVCIRSRCLLKSPESRSSRPNGDQSSGHDPAGYQHRADSEGLRGVLQNLRLQGPDDPARSPEKGDDLEGRAKGFGDGSLCAPVRGTRPGQPHRHAASEEDPDRARRLPHLLPHQLLRSREQLVGRRDEWARAGRLPEVQDHRPR